MLDGSQARCLRDGERIQANPERGCAFWVRAVGLDDEHHRPGNKTASFEEMFPDDDIDD